MNAERILVFAPFGRDAPLAAQALAAAGLEAVVCAGVEDLCGRLAEAGAAILTEEALTPATAGRLAEAMAAQPPWSDLPLIVFGSKETWVAANVTLIDRPVRIRTLISAARAALRARRRQYEVRDLLHVMEQSVRDRDQFLAMLGHELRNPLSALLTASELIDRQCAEELGRERAVVRRQLRHLTRLVDDLLDVSRVTRGKIVLHAAPVDLRTVVQRAVQEFEVAARKQGVQMTAALGDVQVVVSGDLLRLEQIVGNLLHNAVKYTNASGKVEIRLGIEEGQAILQIRDSGVGISREMLPRIFDLFAQAPGAIDRAQGGMGIGLTLVQRLVELHGGSVGVASEGLGKGSEFLVRLPIAAADARIPAAASSGPRRTQRGLKVVVAEDNEDARELLQVALEQMGHAVEPCKDGTSAIERALEKTPDAMLIDLGLPGLDGYEVARKVRGALGGKVRLVALTGYGQPSDRERALAAGFDAFLVKPAELEAVERALRAAG